MEIRLAFFGGELAAGGGDLLPLGVTHGTRNPLCDHAAHELILTLLGRSIPLRARRWIKRNEVNVYLRTERLVQLLAQKIRAPALIIDITDERILDGYTPAGLVRVIARGVENLGDGIAIIDRH